MVVRATFKAQEQVFGFPVHPVVRMLRLPDDYRPQCSQSIVPAKFVKRVVEIDGQPMVLSEISNILVA
jgi:hypothetical protein